MKPRKAEMGIGTLIIFIALLLVAAVAAGVLIQTTGSLQEKALTTGDQARSQISTNAQVVEVSATDGTTRSLTYFTMIMKLAPGSDEIRLDHALLTVSTFNATASLTYTNVTDPSVNNCTTGYCTEDGVGNFTVQYLQRGPNSIDGNLQRGDVIRIYFEGPRSVYEGEDMRISFIPRIGTPTLVEFVTPEVISRERVFLYP